MQNDTSPSSSSSRHSTSFGLVTSAYNIAEGNLRLEGDVLTFDAKPKLRLPLVDITEAKFQYPRTMYLRTNDQVYKFFARGRALPETIWRNLDDLIAFFNPFGWPNSAKTYDTVSAMTQWQALLEERGVPVRVGKGLRPWAFILLLTGLAVLGVGLLIILGLLLGWA